MDNMIMVLMILYILFNLCRSYYRCWCAVSLIFLSVFHLLYIFDYILFYAIFNWYRDQFLAMVKFQFECDIITFFEILSKINFTQSVHCYWICIVKIEIKHSNELKFNALICSQDLSKKTKNWIKRIISPQ